MDINTTLALNDGHRIPLLGFGVFRAQDGDETYRAVLTALANGYRHLDTAMIYGNEESVGRAIRDSGIPRDEIFVTTKLWNDDVRSGKVRPALEASLGRLGLDRVDLYLVHWPADGFVKAYLEMVKLRDEGLITSVGVSNFHVSHLKRLFAQTDVIPVVDQIECHPYLQQRDLIAFCAGHGIGVEAWAPLGGQGSGGDILHNPTMEAVARRHEVTTAQVALRWQLQRSVVILPKSVHEERIRANADLYGFELDGEDERLIMGLNEGVRFGSSPDTFDF
ncbi:MAG: aldo/keto reductase [Succinivibrionaceae bacterium]|nr:aldo/keto reductase [Succinivibrionaceae bacterium]